MQYHVRRNCSLCSTETPNPVGSHITSRKLSCHLRWVADRLGSARGWAQLPSLAVASASGRCLSVNYELMSAGIREAIELATGHATAPAPGAAAHNAASLPRPAAHLPPPATSAAFPASAPASPSASAPAAPPAAPPATSNLIPRAATTLHHYQPSRSFSSSSRDGSNDTMVVSPQQLAAQRRFASASSDGR